MNPNERSSIVQSIIGACKNIPRVNSQLIQKSLSLLEKENSKLQSKYKDLQELLLKRDKEILEQRNRLERLQQKHSIELRQAKRSHKKHKSQDDSKLQILYKEVIEGIDEYSKVHDEKARLTQDLLLHSAKLNLRRKSQQSVQEPQQIEVEQYKETLASRESLIDNLIHKNSKLTKQVRSLKIDIENLTQLHHRLNEKKIQKNQSGTNIRRSVITEPLIESLQVELNSARIENESLRFQIRSIQQHRDETDQMLQECVKELQQDSRKVIRGQGKFALASQNRRKFHIKLLLEKANRIENLRASTERLK